MVLNIDRPLKNNSGLNTSLFVISHHKFFKTSILSISLSLSIVDKYAALIEPAETPVTRSQHPLPLEISWFTIAASKVPIEPQPDKTRIFFILLYILFLTFF